MEELNIFNDLSEHVMLRINSCDEQTHSSNWVESKQHNDYDLWYLKKGHIEIRIDKGVYAATAGDLILFSPKIAYTATTHGSGCSFIFTHFDFGLGNHLRILDNFELSGILSSGLVKEEIHLFLDSYDRYKRGIPLSGIRLKGCLSILIAKIIELYGTNEYKGEFTNHDSDHKHGSLVTLQPIFDFIHNHLHKPLKIEELAVLMGMSEKYFIHYFRTALGVTPGRYIYQLKMNRARELLYSNRYSIREIADLLGYSDPYSFSKAFRRYYNVPPSQFI